jgi:transposase
MAQSTPLTITKSDEHELRQMVRPHRTSAVQAQRARIILALAAGKTHQKISDELECRRTSVVRWKQRLHEAGIVGWSADTWGSRPV